MKTIRVTFDDDLVATVDRVVKKLKTTRSVFARKALLSAITQANIEELERKHKKGYGHRPVGKAEFSVWDVEQEWGSKK
jgi:metal-responsive CopG/Arc/MetJ family transcriptional regulator